MEASKTHKRHWSCVLREQSALPVSAQRTGAEKMVQSIKHSPSKQNLDLSPTTNDKSQEQWSKSVTSAKVSWEAETGDSWSLPGHPR